MSITAIRTINEYVEATDNETDSFSDEDSNGDWDSLELITDEAKLISMESQIHARSRTKSNWEECWECTQCFTINNVQLCIREHGSKCLGCKNQCYIKSQTETIMESKWDSTDAYLLRIDKLWQCKSCNNINEHTDTHCTDCEQASPTTIARAKIKKFTANERANHVIHGFIRVHEYYLEISVIRDLFQIIQKFYVIDYDKVGWVIGGISCMSLANAAKLKVGDKLDHRDSDGRFLAAEVNEIGILGVKIKYEGRLLSLWSWSNYNTQPQRFAEAGSISTRPAHRLKELKVGDNVDVNPIFAPSLFSTTYLKHRGWKKGEIKELDKTSGQVQVEYTYDDSNYKYWIHLDNEDEIAEFGSMTIKSGKTISDLLQDDIDDNKHRGRVNMRDLW